MYIINHARQKALTNRDHTAPQLQTEVEEKQPYVYMLQVLAKYQER